jgi:hypothetical protein
LEIKRQKGIKKMKKLMVIFLDRIKMLQEEKTCVSAAKTPEDLRKCREKVKEERKEFRQEMKEQKGK